jgi:hypothetical protein
MWTVPSFRLCGLNFCIFSLKQLLNMTAWMRSTCRVQEPSHIHEASTCFPRYLLCTFDKSQKCWVLMRITQRYQLHPPSKLQCIKSVTHVLLFKNVTSKLWSCLFYLSILERTALCLSSYSLDILAFHSNIIVKEKSRFVNLQCPKIPKFFGLTSGLLTGLKWRRQIKTQSQ